MTVLKSACAIFRWRNGMDLKEGILIYMAIFTIERMQHGSLCVHVIMHIMRAGLAIAKSVKSLYTNLV